MTRTILLSILLGFALSASAQNYSDKDTKRLVRYIEGNFSTAPQAGVPNVNSEDTILLAMKPIWEERTDGYWFYVEQAEAQSMDNPSIQRVYQVYRSGDRFIITPYSIPGPENFVGAWMQKEPLAELKPDTLSLMAGCEMILFEKGTGFVGNTQAKSCPSERNGAFYASSDFAIDRHGLTSWDRGYNKDGQMVWGKADGPYYFQKYRWKSSKASIRPKPTE